MGFFHTTKTAPRFVVPIPCMLCIFWLAVSVAGHAQLVPALPEQGQAAFEIGLFHSEGEPGLWPDFDRNSIEFRPTPAACRDNENGPVPRIARSQPLPERESPTSEVLSAMAGVRKGALAGKFIYVNAGHGFTNSSGTWKTQRGNLYEMVEDHANADQVNHFFIEYLRNAGATVITLRDIGPQTELYIVDNDDPGFSLFGTWYTSTGPVFWGEDNDAVHYVYANTSATETAVARWTPNIKSAGYYPVFVWYSDSSNRSSAASYRIVHKGGTTTVSLDQYRVGKGWIWLGTYYFASGSGGYVALSNQSTDTGKVVIADAVRFGSGEHPGSGYPWSDMCAHEYTVFSKAPDAVTTVSDVWCRPRMAAYMNNAPIDSVCYISFHSNAYNGKSRGALVLKNSDTNEGGPAPYCDQFNAAIIHQIDDDLKHFWGLPSRNYNVYTSAYGELTHNNLAGEMTATILEVAFHDNADDTNLLKTVGFRRDTARAVLQGIVDYFADTHKNAPKVYLPDAPLKVSALISGMGQVTLVWEAPAYGGYGAHQANGYLVQKSTDGLSWDNGVDVGNVLSYNYTGLRGGEECYFRIRAYNEGGVSFPSETMGVRMTPNGTTPNVLIVAGFSRCDRNLTPVDYDSFNGWSRRVRPWLINSGNYVPLHGKALAAAGYYFDATSNERLVQNAQNLTSYRAVDWMLGRESDVDETLSAAEQTLLCDYLNAGGRLFISGENLGWDLELAKTATQQDRDFLHTVLQVQCTADDGTAKNLAQGMAGSCLAGFPEISFAKNLAQGYYDTEAPDVFVGLGSSTKNALRYSDTGQIAAIQYADASKKLVVMGFPFEAIANPVTRQEVMSAIMNFLLESGR